jgi:hypothetical protein
VGSLQGGQVSLLLGAPRPASPYLTWIPAYGLALPHHYLHLPPPLPAFTPIITCIYLHHYLTLPPSLPDSTSYRYSRLPPSVLLHYTALAPSLSGSAFLPATLP